MGKHLVMRQSLGHFLALRGVQIIALLCAAMVNVVTVNPAAITATSTVKRVPIAGPGERIKKPPPAENEFRTAGQSRSVTNFAIVT
jgi:hypothetical protein